MGLLSGVSIDESTISRLLTLTRSFLKDKKESTERKDPNKNRHFEMRNSSMELKGLPLSA